MNNEFEKPLFSLLQIGISLHHMNKRAETQVGISLVQWCLLRHLIDMPATSAFSLADAAGIHPSTLTQALKRLEKKEYVFISEDPKDSRKKLISITRAGKKTLEAASEKLKDLSTDLLPLGNDLQRLSSFLQRE